MDERKNGEGISGPGFQSGSVRGSVHFLYRSDGLLWEYRFVYGDNLNRGYLHSANRNNLNCLACAYSNIIANANLHIVANRDKHAGQPLYNNFLFLSRLDEESPDSHTDAMD